MRIVRWDGVHDPHRRRMSSAQRMSAGHGAGRSRRANDLARSSRRKRSADILRWNRPLISRTQCASSALLIHDGSAIRSTPPTSWAPTVLRRLRRTGHLDDEWLDHAARSTGSSSGPSPGRCAASLTVPEGIARYAGRNGDTANVRIGSRSRRHRPGRVRRHHGRRCAGRRHRLVRRWFRPGAAIVQSMGEWRSRRPDRPGRRW